MDNNQPPSFFTVFDEKIPENHEFVSYDIAIPLYFNNPLEVEFDNINIGDQNNENLEPKKLEREITSPTPSLSSKTVLKDRDLNLQPSTTSNRCGKRKLDVSSIFPIDISYKENDLKKIKVNQGEDQELDTLLETCPAYMIRKQHYLVTVNSPTTVNLINYNCKKEEHQKLEVTKWNEGDHYLNFKDIFKKYCSERPTKLKQASFFSLEFQKETETKITPVLASRADKRYGEPIATKKQIDDLKKALRIYKNKF